MSNDDTEHKTVIEYDGKSEIPAGMTLTSTYFKELRAVQMFLEPADEGMRKLAFLVLPADASSPQAVWYKRDEDSGDLKFVRDTDFQNMLNGALAVYEKHCRENEQ